VKPTDLTRELGRRIAATAQKQRAFTTALDKDPAVRAVLIKRIQKAVKRPDLPVMVLHQLAQAIEMWGDDKED
jgi:5-formyltetrahydrofolate cyclo-ligase